MCLPVYVYSTFSVADKGTREKKCNAAPNGSIHKLAWDSTGKDEAVPLQA
jgi:hypothetical protein